MAIELNEQESQKCIYIFLEQNQDFVAGTKPNIKISEFLTRAGNSGLWTVQSLDVRLSHIHCA